MGEQTASLRNGVELCYETFGEPSAAPLVLVMGLGGQMSWWSSDFCAALVDRGFFVVRFDNRDVGRSTRVETEGVIVRRQLFSSYLRVRRSVPYTMSHLAADVVGLMDHVGLERAHVVGVSMGGMIAQTVAIEHRDRVLSLTSIMASTGRRSVGWSDPRLLPMLFAPTARSREEYVARAGTTSTLISSPGFARDAAALQALAGQTWDRGYSPDGVLRQLLAVLAQPDRTRALRSLDIPVCVIHGLADRLVHPSGGRATARAIPGAELVLIPGLAHDLPPELDGMITDAIARTARRAEAQSESRR